MAKIVFILQLLLTLQALGQEQHPERAIGVYPKQPPLTVDLLEKLAMIGFDFTLRTPKAEPETPPPMFWEEGEVFLHQFFENKDTFSKWLEFARLKPGNLASFDQEPD